MSVWTFNTSKNFTNWGFFESEAWVTSWAVVRIAGIASHTTVVAFKAGQWGRIEIKSINASWALTQIDRGIADLASRSAFKGSSAIWNVTFSVEMIMILPLGFIFFSFFLSRIVRLVTNSVYEKVFWLSFLPQLALNTCKVARWRRDQSLAMRFRIVIVRILRIRID